MPRRNYRSRQLAFRTRGINAAGSGKPWQPLTKKVKSVTHDTWISKGTVANQIAIHAILAVGNWTAPLWSTQNHKHFCTAGLQGTARNNMFTNAINDSYTQVKVLSSMYRFTIRFTGSNNAGSDFIFAYMFSYTGLKDGELDTSDEVKVQQLWLEMRGSRGWVWRRFSGINSGGSIFPSSGIIDIKVPNVPALARKMNPGQQGYGDGLSGLDDGKDPHLQALLNVNPPPSTDWPLFLHVFIMKPNGNDLILDEITVDVACFQDSRLYRNDITGDLVSSPGDIPNPG